MIFAQSGTIKVAKENSTEIFGLQSNRSGFPLSYIVLIDEKKALFINSFDDETTILRKYQEDEQIDGRIFHGMYKSERNQIYIFLNRGIQFKGSRVDDLLYLVDHTSEQVTFFKIHL
ncbi:MAG: hypothetical protein R2799_11355 [Crocinitomicaceae bacterium]